MHKYPLLYVLALNILYSLGIEVTFKGRQYFSYSLVNGDEISKDKNMITLRFKTIYPSGLLLYSRGTTDYFQLELINGELKCTLYLGGEEKTEIQAGKNLFNGEWHTVIVSRRYRQTTLKVDSQSPATKIIPGDYNKLNLDKHIFVGGMFGTAKKTVGIRAPQFRGCMADLQFNKIKLLQGLQEAISKSFDSKYRHRYIIEGTIPLKCELEEYRPVTFNTPQSFIRVTLRKLPQDNNTFSTSFKFRTFYTEGLLFSRSAIKVKMNVRLQRGVLLYEVTAPNGSKSHISVGHNLHDGEWHEVKASIEPPKVSISLDEYTRSRTLNTTSLLLDFSNKSRMKIFAGRAGSLSKFPGFVGCMLNLKVDSHRITQKYMKKIRQSHGVDPSKCSTSNRCFPNPCYNEGICSQDWKQFFCDCRLTNFEGKRCEIPIHKPTCQDYKELGLKVDSHCLLYMGRNKANKDKPYTALCNVTDPKRAYTVIKHNLEGRSTKVRDGSYINGQYVHQIQYYNIKEYYIPELIKQSKKCRQFIRFDCIKAKLLNSPGGPSHTHWLSLDKKRNNYWGGSTEPGKCACGMSQPSKCAKPTKYCNCDIRDNQWRVDEGYLEVKENLPVMEIQFDMSAGKFDSSFRLGPLECWGKSDKKIAKTNEKNLLASACYSVAEPSTSPPPTQATTLTAAPMTPCPDGKVCFNLTFPTDRTFNIWTNPPSTVGSTTKENTKFHVQAQDSEDDSGLGTPAIVLIACALIIILLLTMKFVLPKIISFVRTHSKRGEYIVPPPGPGYPARLMPLVTKRSSQRGRQITHSETTHLPTEQSNGSAGGGVNSYWV